MKLETIRILRNTPFKPHAFISKKLISKQILDYIEYIKQEKKNNNFEVLNGKYGDIKGIAKFFDIDLSIDRFKSTTGLAIFPQRKIKISTIYASSQLEIRTVFCHELVHILQSDLGIINPIESNSLSSSLRTEQEAESAGAELFKILFPNYLYNKKYFQTYFCEQHILHLHRYLKCTTNDLFEWL